ncbi:MAG: hypothetical protein ACFCGT_22465 [Sandaracinaceae bacterium]
MLRTLSLLPLLAVIGCGPPWIAHRLSGPPSALAGTQALLVSFDLGQVVIDGYDYPAFLALAEPEEVDNVERALAELQPTLYQEFAARVPVPAQRVEPTPAGPGEVRMVAVLEEVIRGPRGPCCGATRVTWRFEFFVDGTLTDSISVPTEVGSSITRPSVEQRAQAASRRAGAVAASFVQKNLG